MNVIYLNSITRRDVLNNPTWLFVFGDNDIRTGYGGQAKEMRGFINSFGIRVKKHPASTQQAFYSDEEYEENTSKIREDINKIVRSVSNGVYIGVVAPSAGIGTGLAQLKERAPRTAEFLKQALAEEGIQNGVEG
jgi:hypothetical protein